MTQLAVPGTSALVDAPTVRLSGTVILGRDAARVTQLLAHPSVSKRHASITVDGSTRTIRDLGSTNGTFVNGERISGARALADGNQVRIGPFAFVVRGYELQPASGGADAELRAERLTVRVMDKDKGVELTLLNDVSVAFRPGEFCAVIGPSGCGKSTVIEILSGRMRPTQGGVTWNGVDLHKHFDTIKQDIAYVPQREILPGLLTVRGCLEYTARLRLPADTTPAERAARVNEVIARVGLTERADTKFERLSGGQKKRAALANELLVNPRLLFLDEVTSGLDESTDREMMILCRSLADSGIAIVMVTHTLANVGAWCDSMLVMSKGQVAYHGPVSRARAHFGVTELGEVYQVVAAPGANAVWAQRHAAGSPYYARVAGVAGRAPGVAGASSGSRGSAPNRSVRRPPFTSQLGVLVARYFDITSADVGSLVVIGIQALVVGVVLRIVFGGETPAPPRSYQLMFLLGVSAFWFGCNNAAKEIIKELRLFEMERNVNLRISTYVLSKFAVLALLGAVEVGILFAVVRLSGLTFAHQGVMLGLMILAMAAGTGCGLFLSGLTVALQKTEDVAVGLVPIALIPQILLANALIAPLPDFAKSIGEAVITAFWSYRAELHAFGVTVENGGHAWRFLVWHAAGFTVLAMIALWIGGLRGHKRD